MNELIGFLSELVNNLIYGPDFGVQVNLAIAPLAIAGIAAGVGALAGGANYLAGRGERRRLRSRAQRLEDLQLSTMGEVGRDIEALQDRAQRIETDATAQELYGPEIQALMDRTQAGQATVGRQLSRSVMAGGGDVSGQVGATLQRLTASTNRSLQDIMADYNERTDRRNLQAESRQDQLISQALGARQNQFRTISGIAESARSRSTQKATADKQFFMDAIGTGSNIGSIFAGGG